MSAGLGPTRAAMAPGMIVAVLMLLLSIQPISTDLYLPALPTLQREFMASTAAAQLTLSALIICFGLGPLVCGPLADRFGRRPVLLVGMALYTAASLLATMAQSIDALVLARALQGVAMASAVTCGRSFMRDLFQPHQGARVMARALGGLGAVWSLAGGLGVAGISMLGVHNVWAVMLPLWLFAFGHGVHQSCGQAAVVGEPAARPLPNTLGGSTT